MGVFFLFLFLRHSSEVGILVWDGLGWTELGWGWTGGWSIRHSKGVSPGRFCVLI